MGSPAYSAIIIGGGFYGCVLAAHLHKHGGRVLLLERDGRLLGRASFNNQARVHNGYHYPRSLTTALRSRVNYPRFIAEYADCVDTTSSMLYAVAKTHSKVTASQFSNFCERIGANISPAHESLVRLFNGDHVEGVFHVEEAVFNADSLRTRLQHELDLPGIDTRFNCEAEYVRSAGDNCIEVTWTGPGGIDRANAAHVYNCTYSRINRLLLGSSLAPVHVKHELTELALVDVPEELEDLGVTVMCGPFFSLMPFPAEGLHTLSHVRYTPHTEWHEDADTPYRDPYSYLGDTPRTSAYPRMIRDASRFLPVLERCIYRKSLWEIKTVLPRSETDDSRPILMRETPGMPGLVNILGAKIDNVSDMIALLDKG